MPQIFQAGGSTGNRGILRNFAFKLHQAVLICYDLFELLALQVDLTLQIDHCSDACVCSSCFHSVDSRIGGNQIPLVFAIGVEIVSLLVIFNCILTMRLDSGSRCDLFQCISSSIN